MSTTASPTGLSPPDAAAEIAAGLGQDIALLKGTLVEAEPSPPAQTAEEKAAGELLFKPGECSPPCGLMQGEWQKLPIWRCRKCGFETFEEAAAIAHLSRA